jgi:V-type H+-transporting ATPase subunit d
MSNLAFFNVDDGFVEAVARGFRGRILTQSDYQTLCQAETLEDLRINLSTAEFDYGPFIEDLQGDKLEPGALHKRLNECLITEFQYLRSQATGDLAKFFDFMTYQFMIDNLVHLIKGALKSENITELLANCNPLGFFEEIKLVCSQPTAKEMFDAILVDTPLAEYFVECLSIEDLTELNVDTMKDKLYKEYLTHFMSFCKELGGTTAEVMTDLLEFEADRRAINIAVNSISYHDIATVDKQKLNPDFGTLYPEGFLKLAEAKDENEIYSYLEKEFGDTFGALVRDMRKDEGTEHAKCIEELLMDYDIHLHTLSFYQQFHYGIFYSYMKLKEQEIRNIHWIAECINQNKKHRINQNVVFIF